VVGKQAVLISASIVKQRCNSCILSTECHIHRSCESTCKTNSDTLLVFHISLLNLTHLNGTNNVYLTYDICILNHWCFCIAYITTTRPKVNRTVCSSYNYHASIIAKPTKYYSVPVSFLLAINNCINYEASLCL